MPLDSSTAITIAGIECWEEDVSETFSRSGSTGNRTIVCAWSNRIALVNALLGGASETGVITNYNPAASYPDAPWMFVDSIDPEGEGVRSVGTNGMLAYEWARMKVTYKSPPDGTAQDASTLGIEYSGEMLVAPRDVSTFKWAGDGEDVPPEATPGIPLTTATFTLTKKNLTRIPTALILSLLDHVNESSFEGGGVGKVIYKGGSVSAKYVNNGVQNIDLTHKFIYRSEEWNSFLRPSSGIYERIVRKGNGRPLFETGDLGALMR